VVSGPPAAEIAEPVGRGIESSQGKYLRDGSFLTKCKCLFFSASLPTRFVEGTYVQCVCDSTIPEQYVPTYLIHLEEKAPTRLSHRSR
jgi:hypothetical protein